jgi:uncharacterized delta-60 repeat protein
MISPPGCEPARDHTGVRLLTLPVALAIAALPVRGATGDLDPTFGDGGKVITDFNGNNDFIHGVAVQNDGKIVVAGETNNGSNSAFALVRYTARGTPDTGFGTDGKVIASIGPYNSFAYGLALQPDGKIVAAGFFEDGVQHFALVRCTASGEMDTSFGTGGRVTTVIGLGSRGHSVAVQSDGKILVAGYSLGTGFNFTVARYTANGALDPNFGTGGIVITQVVNNLHSYINCIAVQDDGKIVLAGDVGSSLSDFAMVRYTAGGALDPGFGTGGIVTTNFNGQETCLSLALQSDGKIILGGCNVSGLVMARYTTDGSLDPGFGTGGKVSRVGFGCARGIAVQSDGKIVVATEATVHRFTTSGATDSTFGTGGGANTPFSSLGVTGKSMALQSDGKIVVTGDTPGHDIGVLRYLSDDGPEIVVEQPAGNDVIDGGAGIVVGTVNPGGATSKTFTIRNTGTTELKLGTFSIDGANSGAFVVNLTGTASSVTPGNSTTFSVSFVPGAGGAGVYHAVLHIANDDSDENPFDIALTGTVLAPEIVVEQPTGNVVTDGGAAIVIGTVNPGGNTSKTFTIRNTGTTDLTLGTFSIDGANAAAFAVNHTGTTSPVTPGQSTTFTVSFVSGAGGAGVHNAALHIANDDSDENPFDIALTGTVLSPLEAWRLQWFGSSGNTGIGADGADPNGNGIKNLVEYALGGDPVGPGTPASIRLEVSVGPENRMQLTFTQLLDRADVILTVAASDSLDGIRPPLARSTGGGPFTALAAGSTVTETRTGVARTVTVTDRFLLGDPAHPRRFMWLRVTIP